MYKEKFSGIICKINSIDISYRVELEMDELNRAILIIHKVKPEIAKNLEDNEDKNTIILQLDNDDYLCIFGAYVRRATYSTRLVENVPEDTTAEVILLSTSMIKGKRIFSEKDRFGEKYYLCEVNYHFVLQHGGESKRWLKSDGNGGL